MSVHHDEGSAQGPSVSVHHDEGSAQGPSEAKRVYVPFDVFWGYLDNEIFKMFCFNNQVDLCHVTLLSDLTV